MKRLYYLTKDLESVETISNDIHQSGITDWNFHVLSKDENGLYKRHIHSANMLQKTDVIKNIELGLLRGLGVGLVTVLVLSFIPIHGTPQSSALLLAIFFASILLGGLHGSLLGYINENYKLKPFHDKIQQGYFLIMIDVSKKQVEMGNELMKNRHDEASYCTQDSTLVMPFDHPKAVRF